MLEEKVVERIPERYEKRCSTYNYNFLIGTV